MRRQFIAPTAAVLILAGGMAAVNAQQAPLPPMPDEEGEMDQEKRAPPGRYSRDDEFDDSDDSRGMGMSERNVNRGPARKRQPRGAMGTMAFEMMGAGTGGPGMVRMMMILMDSDGDGAVSLQEFQSGHERMFKAMDTDKNGRLTLEEVQSFGRALRTPGPQQR